MNNIYLVCTAWHIVSINRDDSYGYCRCSEEEAQGQLREGGCGGDLIALLPAEAAQPCKAPRP